MNIYFIAETRKKISCDKKICMETLKEKITFVSGDKEENGNNT